MGEEIIVFRGITKRFPPDILANDRVSFGVKKGTVHILLGENGAGKTTLMNILYGIHQPDEGSIFLRGKEVRVASPQVAIKLGIGMVHQHFRLVPNHRVWENVVLGFPHVPHFFPAARARVIIRDLSREYGLDVDPDAYVWQLSAGEQQRVEILRALLRKAEILILDEPTSVLTPSDTERLFSVLRKMREEGKTCLFITHKFSEVGEIGDRITVLRKGRVVGTVTRGEVDFETLASMMVGEKVPLSLEKVLVVPGRPLLQIEDLWVLDDRGLPGVRGVSFVVREGEIVGVAGVVGNGQRELAEALAGLRTPLRGRVFLEAKDLTGASPKDVQEAGLGYVPEDRRVSLVGDLTVAENLVLRDYRRPFFRRGILLNWKRVQEHAARVTATYRIVPSLPHLPVRLLSGGNRQRVALAQALTPCPRVLVIANPTAGLDVLATSFIHRLLLSLQQEGIGILLISGDLDEILALSDRILVLYRGKIVGERVRPSGGWTGEDRREIGLMMGGVSEKCLVVSR
ncbi:MAG: ABC transporter ATP-binding protein [Candidatus Caldatribacterium sp.]|uniref:ABC transporter ATP-binding protein n=1 Tax=Candidatus Caldatribacterium sp. TaxID=2282143 RepID=UPI00299B5BCB|nr:ABC transporter ATP-binding protein [Candidatus Caldatribacterium sp.]MCX7730752.1 ABC transporter ATP-binding protein [Candidatus Caldatribacterium sp.]MDW8080639.1 ABC transporter ATP-binding protein [Candidatus Calescibacterium sp.]